MTYAMTLDNSWELMTEEEMYDVNGGFYLSNETIVGILVSLGINPLGTFLVGLGAYKVGLAVAGVVAAIPGVGWIIAAYLIPHAADFGSAITSAVIHGKGVEIGWGFWWGIPRLSFDVK